MANNDACGSLVACGKRPSSGFDSDNLGYLQSPINMSRSHHSCILAAASFGQLG